MKNPKLGCCWIVVLWALVAGCGDGGGSSADDVDATGDGTVATDTSGDEAPPADVAGVDAAPHARLDACYSPCRAGLRKDGKYLACVDGLLEGCLGQTTCVGGWCVTPPAPTTGVITGSFALEAAAGSTCATDCDCPEHGACMDGTCGHQCQPGSGGAQCGADEVCFHSVCRRQCSSAPDSPLACSEGQWCSVGDDGVTGRCLPSCQAQEVDAGQPACAMSAFEVGLEPFEVSGADEGVVSFRPDSVSASLTLTNHTGCELAFRVKRQYHAEFTDQGSKNVTENPLSWLTLSSGDATATPTGTLDVRVPVDGQTVIEIGGATNPQLANWTGGLLLQSLDKLGDTTITLTYVSGASGAWEGKAYYFANFGTDHLDAWLASGRSPAELDAVNNAFLRRWDLYRRGFLSTDNFLAMLSSTLSGSWSWPNVEAACPTSVGACYPFANPDEGNNDDGVEKYSDDLARYEIPSGMVELPVGLYLKQDPSDASLLSGRIASKTTLHYAGDPSVTLRMAKDAAECDVVGEYGTCINVVKELAASVVVGGRFRPDERFGCSDVEGYATDDLPWLLQDFQAGTVFAESHRTRAECRDEQQPYAAVPADSTVSRPQLNSNLAASNPLPDGQSMVRQLQIVDGALVNKDRLFILFKEDFHVDMVPLATPDPELPASLSEDFSGYGILVLTRRPDVPLDGDYAGNVQQETRPQPEGVLGLHCSADLLQRVGYAAMPEAKDDLDDLASLVLSGVPADVDLVPVTQTVHYLCWETGQFEKNAASPGECPLGSPVTFFYFTGDDPLAVEHDCAASAQFQTVQAEGGDGYTDTYSAVIVPGTCGAVLQQWRDQYADEIVVDPHWVSSCPAGQACTENPWDRTEGKSFQTAPSQDGPVMADLQTALVDAFRYKIMFRSRQGRNVGFAPEPCIANSTDVPYCYSPPLIEELQARSDCAMYLYLNHFRDATGATAQALRTFLRGALSSRCLDAGLGAEACTWPQNRVDGLETMTAELMVMLGDEAYTAAFSARFDLAASAKAAFEGSLFEPQGIDLGGVAGFEMYSLYKATQYYQLAQDRFYSMLPALTLDLQLASDPEKPYLGLVTLETVADYLDRLIRASTQKARAWSEIAKRYQGFNRPDLAGRVLQRAYTSTYLESILVTRLMHHATDVLSPESRPQIRSIIEKAQVSYRAALLAMRDVNQSITSAATVFGFPVDYVPFPAIGLWELNPIEKALATAFEAVNFAAAKEATALADKREYDTDAASFQAELVQIRSTYESSLVDLCGSMDGDDGVVHPAILEYAYNNEKARTLGDPCGLMGTGAIYEALVNVRMKQMIMEKLIGDRDGTLDSMEIEMARVSAVCAEAEELKDVSLTAAGVKMSLQAIIDASQIVVNAYRRAQDTVTKVAETTKCSVGLATDCPGAVIAVATIASSEAIENVVITATEALQAGFRAGMAAADIAVMEVSLDAPCDLAIIDSEATIANLVLDFQGQNMEIAQAALDVHLAYAQAEALANKAVIQRAEYNAIWEQAINVEAARNDPNIRIYKNDAVINAEKAFDRAVKEAYRATKVFEYYTSQSYAHLVDLFLVRMVSAGDYNLENYMWELQTAYNDFLESYGRPDRRLQIVSLRDDVFQIPFYRDDAPGETLSETERAGMFVERLTGSYGPGGYSVTFPTQLADLSPKTRNHKIEYVEIELVGANLGDAVARAYLVQAGTGTLYGVDGTKQYYRLPSRTAVVDLFLNGERPFDDAGVYPTYNLRDRPLANTQWQLVLDTVGEKVNRDVAIESLTDVRIYLYYNDFTAM